MSSEWDDLASPNGSRERKEAAVPLHHLLQAQQQQTSGGSTTAPTIGFSTTLPPFAPGNSTTNTTGGVQLFRKNSSKSVTQKVNYSFPVNKLKIVQETDKQPLVLVACGSYSPVTHLHLRMFEIALDHFTSSAFEVMGGYFSPVSDAYAKPGLASWEHRVEMLALAVRESTWIMCDDWEASQTRFQRTATVLDHFNQELNRALASPSSALAATLISDSGSLPEAQPVKFVGGCVDRRGRRRPYQIMLLAGGDLIQSFAVPNLWKEADLNRILGDYGCVVIERTGADVNEFLLSNDVLYKHRSKVYVVKQFIHNDISSTKIRLFCKRGMSIKYLLPDSVIDYIQKNGLYSVQFVEKTKTIVD